MLLAEVRRTSSRRPSSCPRPRSLREYAAANDKATIEYVLVPASRLESAPSRPTPTSRRTSTSTRTATARRSSAASSTSWSTRPRSARRSTPTDADIAAEYEKRKDTFTVPEQVNAAHILIAVKPDGGAERRRGRQGEGREHRRAGEGHGRRLREARQREHRRPERQDERRPASAVLPRPDGARVRGRPAFAMEPGEIRGPDQDAVRIPHHQARLEDRPARTRSLDEARAALAAELDREARPRREVDRLARELAEKLKKHVVRPPTTSCASSRRDFVTFNTTEWAAKGDADPGHRRQPEVRRRGLDGCRSARSPRHPSRPRAASSSSSPPRSAPAGLPPFAELKPRLEQDWKAERREKDALAQLEPAAKELSAGATLATLAPRYGTEVKTTTEFGPGGPVPEIGAAPELAAAVFRTPQGQAGPPVAVPTGFVLFRVLTRTEGRPRRVRRRRRNSCARSIRAREAERLTRAYLAQMRAERKVEVNEPAARRASCGTRRRAAELIRPGRG